MIGERDPWEKLDKKLREMDMHESARLLEGHARTFEDYRESVGYLKAVSELRAEFDTINKTRSFGFGG